MDDLGDILSRLRAAWMASGSARNHCPEAWLPVTGDGPGAELALAALAGQALQVAFRPAPGGPLAARDPLPELALPPLPTALRARARRLLAAHQWILRPLLMFLAARGVTMHPADWLPGKRADVVPALYAPWIAWLDAVAPAKPPAKPKVVDVTALAAELAAMLTLETFGLLRRRKRLNIEKLKTAAQNIRRQELFAVVPLAALAAALGTTASELVQTAPTGVDAGITAFAAMTAASGSPEEQRQLFASMLEDAECPLASARPLAAAIDQRHAAELLPAILRREQSDDFKLAVELAGEALGIATMAEIAASPAYALLQARLQADATERAAQVALGTGLTALGLLADGQAAQSLIATFLAAGLSRADPKLDALHLNVALSPEMSA